MQAFISKAGKKIFNLFIYPIYWVFKKTIENIVFVADRIFAAFSEVFNAFNPYSTSSNDVKDNAKLVAQQNEEIVVAVASLNATVNDLNETLEDDKDDVSSVTASSGQSDPKALQDSSNNLLSQARTDALTLEQENNLIQTYDKQINALLQNLQSEHQFNIEKLKSADLPSEEKLGLLNTMQDKISAEVGEASKLGQLASTAYKNHLKEPQNTSLTAELKGSMQNILKNLDKILAESRKKIEELLQVVNHLKKPAFDEAINDSCFVAVSPLSNSPDISFSYSPIPMKSPISGGAIEHSSTPSNRASGARL